MLMCLLLLGACTREGTMQTEDMAVPGGYSENREQGTGETVTDVSEEENLIGEKVVQTVEVAYETLDFSGMTTQVTELVEKHEAYVEHSYETSYTPSGNFTPGDTNRQYRQISYTFRVPTDALDAFLEDLEGTEAVKTSERIGTEDVTQDYRDTETRIRVLQTKEERLNTLLEQAETVEEILLIEDQLSDAIAERESLQARLDSYDRLIDYTAVYVTVTERPRIANTRGEGLSFWQRAKEAFVDSVFAFYYWIQDALIWLIYAVPFLLVIGLVVWLAIFLKRRYNRPSERKNLFKKKKTDENQSDRK